MEDKKEIQIHYIKSDRLETKLATGAIGGITANALINMDFFLDRVPIPQSVSHEVYNGLIGREMDRSGKVGIIREVHTSIVFDISNAKAFVDWIIKRIDEIEKNPQVTKQ